MFSHDRPRSAIAPYEIALPYGLSVTVKPLTTASMARRADGGLQAVESISDAVPEHCRACRDEGSPCARGEPGADEQLCPCREHRLVSRQEHEAWEVPVACLGQLRLTPTGHVIGIDLDAALTLAAARGHDLAVLSELLPAAEAGFVEALCADADRPH